MKPQHNPRYVDRLILIVAALTIFSVGALASIAQASTDAVHMTWDIPTLYADESPLPAHEIDGYTIKRWLNNDRLDDIRVDGGLTLEHVMPDARPGVYVFMIATVARGITGEFSDPYALPLGLIPISGAKPPGLELKIVCETDAPRCSLEIKN